MKMEHIKTPKVENVRMLDRFNAKKPSVGTLYITATHLIFVDPEGKKETWILLMHIASVEKLPLSALGSPLLIKCKTFLCVTFVIPRERDCHEVFNTIQQLSLPTTIAELYCFQYTSCNDDIPKNVGWTFYDVQAEYQRMGAPDEYWCLTTINKDYEICDTYPRFLYVPATASTPMLVGSSRFRSKGRLPVLSYLHKNKAAICRCSQPLSGFKARCLEDEQLLNCILKANSKGKFMYVVDTRPRINALANRATGKGYENENFYENIKFYFLGIENIHTMRSSLAKLIDTCEMKVPSMNAFLNGLESSGWLRHIKAILDTSFFIANAIDEGINVLVHCSDGWDRTAQTCSLASLFLDSYYRTLQGFQALIEKEWLSFGHKFTDRCGHIQGDSREMSPVFTQFIDCVWQLTQQFPSSFQFNERYLLTLHDHVFSCQYGTFVGNCEKDRLDLRLLERTYSLWGYIASHMREYLNPLYKPEANGSSMLTPNLSPQAIKFWRGMYNRFENGVHPRENFMDLLSATKDHSSSLEDHIRLLEKRIAQLTELLGHADTPSKDVDSVMNDSSIIESGSESETSGLFRSKDLHLKYPSDSQSNRHSYTSVVSDAESGFEDGKDGISPQSTDSRLRTDSSGGFPSLDQLAEELNSVSLDWKSLRNIRACSCSTPFDHFSRKYHCWKCGDVFCMRCIDKNVSLPGHLSRQAVPVCRPCYKEISRSLSVETP